MNAQVFRSRGLACACSAWWLACVICAQEQPRPAAPPAPPSAQESAPIDLTGYWVSIVNEDWRWRMVTPAKGDYASVPITPEARSVADQWDPAKDEAAGEQCRSYGAPAIMRVPGRVHITWQDSNTLKVETDAGQQVRLLHFGKWTPPKGAPATWQGDSVATWEIPHPMGAGGGGGGAGTPIPAAANAPKYGDLKVVTTHIRPGYLRKNGIPYSAHATLTEFWNLNKETNGEQWIVISTVVEDPQYLQEPWLTSLHFKREPDGSKWDPQPCSSRW
jgi:hypothetical protein